MTVRSTTSPAERATELLAAIFAGSSEDPSPLYDEARELGDGVHLFSPMNLYFAFRYDDVQAIAREPAFSCDYFDTGGASIHDSANAEHVRFMDVSRRLMIFSDPPRHTALRNLVRRAFTPRAVERWRPLVEQSVDRLLDKFTAGDRIEAVSQLSIDVPVDVICAVLGVSEYERAMVRSGSDGFGQTFTPSVVGAARDTAITNALILIDNIDRIVEDKRAQLEDDLISMVIESQAEVGDEVDAADLLAQTAFLIAAGNETTVNMLTNGLSLLLRYPEQRELLQRNPALIDGFVNEILRFEPPIPSGTMVFQVLAAANRDPRKFDDPGEFRIDRSANHHLTFNQGAHTCVGAPLARLEGRVFFERFLERFPNFGPGDDPAKRSENHVLVRSIQSLPIHV
jgi:cytochrome P450